MTRDQLLEALRSRWYLTKEEIDAVLADPDFFKPYLRKALADRAERGAVTEEPMDSTDVQSILLLTEWKDDSIIPDVLKCFRMSEDDVERLYGDAIMIDFWLPIAALGAGHLEALWDFVTDNAIVDYIRLQVVEGVVAMHHFRPEMRDATVGFIKRLADRTELYPGDQIARILSDCLRSGLSEFKEQAFDFARSIKDEDFGFFGMATGKSLEQAARKGAVWNFISERPHDVYGINRSWQEASETMEETKESAKTLKASGKGTPSDIDEEEEEDVDDEIVDNDDGEEIVNSFEDDITKIPSKIEPSPWGKVGRNEPCPCGSGKKFKKCHGANNIT